MEYLSFAQQLTSSIGGIGVIGVIILLWKLGFFDKKNGNGKQEYINETQKEFNEQMAIHAEKANEEMGDVKKELAVMSIKIEDGFKSLKEDIKELKHGN